MIPAITKNARKKRLHRRVVMLVYNQTQILDITGPLEVFGRTTRWLNEQGITTEAAYELEMVAESKGVFQTSSKIQMVADGAYRDVKGPIDTLLIAGGIGYAAEATNTNLLDWIKQASRHSRRVGSICTGSFILAKAGLLENRKATTHWAYCSELQQKFPSITVDCNALYVQDGKFFTSAGVTAGIDLALALVEEDWGSTIALNVAQELVIFYKRPGGQSQFSRHLEAQKLASSDMSELQVWILENLDQGLTVKKIAAKAAMSERHFIRRFTAEAGMPPGKYVQQVRVEAARRKLETTQQALKSIATECGFSSPEIMRRTFQKFLGIPPNEYRMRFHS